MKDHAAYYDIIQHFFKQANLQGLTNHGFHLNDRLSVSDVYR